MSKRTEQMRLGAFLVTGGHHAAGWRHPDAHIAFELADFVDLARTAEAAKFDMIFLADLASSRLSNMDAASKSANQFACQMFEPITLLSALAGATSRIGLAATASTMYYEPYNVARLFASLDRLSRGRAAWNIVTSADLDAARNFGVERPGHDDRYKIAEEFVDVVRGLWDSWEDDAFVCDRTTGRFFDPAKVHFLNYKGAYFTSRGPLNLPRTPQGHPVLVQAGSSGVGQNLAARVADVVFTAQSSPPDLVAFYKELKERAAAFGRAPSEILILPGITPIVANSEAEGKAKLGHLNELLDIENALSVLGTYVDDVDWRQFHLDEPLPEIPETGGHQSRRRLVLEVARRENMTLRQLAQWFGGTRGHWMLIGTADQIADKMEECFDSYGCDGFNVLPVTFPGALNDFASQVIPELQRRGRFRKDYEGTTLRDHLGLRRMPFRDHREPRGR